MVLLAASRSLMVVEFTLELSSLMVKLISGLEMPASQLSWPNAFLKHVFSVSLSLRFLSEVSISSSEIWVRLAL